MIIWRIFVLLLYIVSIETAAIVYSRNDTSVCADASLESRVGICPRSIVVLFGRLSEVSCPELGFNFKAGNMAVIAGPCGKIIFDLYKKNREDVKLSTTVKVLRSHSELIPHRLVTLIPDRMFQFAEYYPKLRLAMRSRQLM